MLALNWTPPYAFPELKDVATFRRAEDIERLAQAFRIAGVPE